MNKFLPSGLFISQMLVACGGSPAPAGAAGDTWYWYERVPLNSPAPHDGKGVVADGTGGSGPAKDIFVGCHQGARSDAQHSGHDFVYTQVK